MIKFFLILTIGIIPLVLWGGYFYLKNPRKEGFGVMAKIFGLGTLSVIPVLLFHQWLMKRVVGHIETVWSIFEHSFLKAFLELFLLILFILAFVSLFALIDSLFVAFSKKSTPNSTHHKVSIYKKLYNLSPLLILFIGLLMIDGITNLAFQQTFLLSAVGSIIVFAVLEEYFKYMINPFLVRQKIHSISTAMVHALYIGLAFAFIENLLFFYVNINSPDLESIIIYRSIFTTLLHICASGILGYFYGLALFSRSMLTNYEIEKGKYELPFWMRPFLKKETGFQSISVTQGFIIASLIHVSFNLLLNEGMRNTASALVIIVTIGIVLLLRSKSSQVQYGLIGTTVMPEIDFEQLRLKISVLKEVKNIRRARMV